MTLLELLVKELPKRGGWPDGVIKISQDYDGEVWCWFGHDYGNVKSLGRINVLADNHRKQSKDEDSSCFVTREQYEAALAASKPEWDGEGFPPVGCECEWQDKSTKQWTKVSIAYSSEWVTVIREDKIVDAVEIAIENYGDEARRQFRPIRSEEDKKRDAAIANMDVVLLMVKDRSQTSSEIYDAIASGKIPGVKLED